MSYLIRRVLAKPRLILDEMCRLYGKFASYLRRVLCKTHLIFSRINGPIVNSIPDKKAPGIDKVSPRLIKESLPIIVLSITSIINASLTSGVFPTSRKIAEVYLMLPWAPGAFYLRLPVSVKS